MQVCKTTSHDDIISIYYIIKWVNWQNTFRGRRTDRNWTLRCIMFQLEEKCIELEGARARVRQLEAQGVSNADRSSMRDLQPVVLPDEPGLSETPRQRPSRIPRHKAAAPRPPTGGGTGSASGGTGVSRPPSSHSVRSSRSATSCRSRQPSSGGPAPLGSRKDKSSVPVRRSPSHDPKVRGGRSFWNSWFTFKDT